LPAWLILLVVFAIPGWKLRPLGVVVPGQTVLIGGVSAHQSGLPLAAVMVGAVLGRGGGDAVGYPPGAPSSCGARGRSCGTAAQVLGLAGPAVIVVPALAAGGAMLVRRRGEDRRAGRCDR
jgi:hypothetical protein